MKSFLRFISILFAGLFFTTPSVRADTVYISYGDRRGYSRPDTIEQFDSATLADLGPFATNGVSLPQGLALDDAGNLYVANYGNGTITKFTPDGVGSVFAHTGAGPQSLAFDAAGNLYVANYWANTIERFTPDGVGSVFADSNLSYPTGLAIDSKGNIYVANGGDLTIYRFTPLGESSLFATAHWYNRPFGGIAFDAEDNLYLGCQATNTPGILRFAPDGVSSIFAGDGFLPTGLAFDSTGNLYVACYGSDNIVKYSPEGVVLDYTYTAHSPYGIAIQPAPDTLPPRILAISATPDSLWPPNHHMLSVSVIVDAVDDRDPSPVAHIKQVISNEPENPFVPDWEITGPLSVTLRAERLGSKNGRTYTIVVECEDASGNVAYASVDVVVPHDRR